MWRVANHHAWQARTHAHVCMLANRLTQQALHALVLDVQQLHHRHLLVVIDGVEKRLEEDSAVLVCHVPDYPPHMPHHCPQLLDVLPKAPPRILSVPPTVL
jgi:hypothetical protein